MAVRPKIKWPFIIPVLVVCFFLSLLSGRTVRAPWYEQWLSNAVYPFQWISSTVADAIVHASRHYILLTRIEKENERLSKKIKELQGKLIQFEEVKKENERLLQLWQLAPQVPGRPVVARVIAYDSRTEFKSLLINKGKADGLKPFLPVVTAQGVVGRVGPVFSNKAHVLLITDPNSVIDVFVERSRTRGLMVGTSKTLNMQHTMLLNRFEYLRHQSDVVQGDEVVASGFDQIFPKGWPVGTVEFVKSDHQGVFRHVEVVPYVNFNELEEVMVFVP